MNRIEKYFRLAKQVAENGKDLRQYRLGAVGIRSDGIIVTATNIPCQCPQEMAHAEARLARKLDRGATVFVVRILRCGALAPARPCMNCQAAMWKRGVKKVYYSISNVEYGVMKL